MYFLKVLTLIALLSLPPASSATDHTPFPQPASKKGLQVQMVEDAIALGVKHAALNFNLAQMIDLISETNSFPWTSGEKLYHFKRGYLDHIDRQVHQLSGQGIVVSLILLYYKSGNSDLDRIMLHPNYDPASPNSLSAFNTTNPQSTALFQACIEFLADRYSGKNANSRRVWNYILGNEVNSHWFWSNMGRVSMPEFAEDYLRALRIAHAAVRKSSAHARVYVSLEHHWNIRYPGGDDKQAFAARPFLEFLARRSREQGDFDWHVAFHPYPEDLFECRTWNDKSATLSPATPRITFKNLELLPRFLSSEQMLYKGQPRRIILSEQGFHSRESPDGELLQAAAYCYAYYKTAKLDGIDSFILHRHVDHGHEGGLNLGLWTRHKQSRSPADPLKPKLIYDVFKKADAPDWEKTFSFALPVIGIQTWSELDPK